MKSVRFLRGFTLVELLIVIAVLGVLAVVVLVAIDPLEQFARARDGGRKSSISQLGRSVQAYYTSQNANFKALEDAGAAWMTTLQTAGEIKSIPSNANGPTFICGGASQNSICFDTNQAAAGGTGEAVVYLKLESKSDQAKCTTAADTRYVWSSADGRAGIVCNATISPGTQTFATGQ